MSALDAALIGSGIGLGIVTVIIAVALAIFAGIWMLYRAMQRAAHSYRELVEEVEAEEMLEQSL